MLAGFIDERLFDDSKFARAYFFSSGVFFVTEFVCVVTNFLSSVTSSFIKDTDKVNIMLNEPDISRVVEKIENLLSEDNFGKCLLAGLIFFGVEERFRENGIKLPEYVLKCKERLESNYIDWCLRNAEEALAKQDYRMAKGELQIVRLKCAKKNELLPSKYHDLLQRINNS